MVLVWSEVTLRVSHRQLLLSLPALAAMPRSCVMPQPAPGIRVRTLNHFGLAVSDTTRSVDFYRNLFGMPIQARSGTTTILRVGVGPHFLSISPAGSAPPS